MKVQQKDVLNAVEQQAVLDLLNNNPPLRNGLSKIFDFEMRMADENCRNEALADARTAVTASYAARGRVFQQLFALIAERAEHLIARNVNK